MISRQEERPLPLELSEPLLFSQLPTQISEIKRYIESRKQNNIPLPLELSEPLLLSKLPKCNQH